MKIQELKEILKSAYSQEKWVNTLKFLSGTKNLLTILLEPKHEEIKSAKAKEIVREIVRLGTLKTTDGISLPIYDVTLHDDIKIEYNRVGVNDLLKTHILKDAIKGAIVTFHYREEYDKSEWRFSFISKFGSDYFAEVESIETNPKKYTYIFGTPEEHRTALERLYNLEQSRFRLEDFFEAFNVEPVSKKFFDDYKKFYIDFVDEIYDNKQSRAVFEKEDITKDELEKDIRNFVKRLLGRLVFLYFLQKKRWLGASNKNYEDGDTDFLFHLFNYNEESRVHFYNKWLSPLFFNALNTPNRINDGFELADGNSVWIPFLNGGLFDESHEPKKHREIQFPPTLFELLFKFFNGYNFTIYENSPEDHTVAVDPEMLGHIFENLLEDNKDKGAFYTPKEIVHYMTQESLIEYLNTHLSHSKEAIENLIKNHNTADFTRDDLKQVEKLIDQVKICDPAIGSGAFPMGLLQEIFALKAVIHYELGYAVWSPAKIKQDIIQNSIYGVDIEEGAVDIARLRFWLSLVVDEPIPRALPNLDYKIVVGNSLVSKLNNNIIDIDWDLKSSVGKADEYIKLLQNGLTELTAKQKEYFFSEKKAELKLVIRNLKIDILINQLSFNKEHFLNKNQVKLDMGFGLKQSEIKENNRINEQVDNFNKTINELNQLKDFPEKPLAFFDWKLNFPEVLNPLLKENGRLNTTGFDIVIGNPPYVSVKSIDQNFKGELLKKYKTAEGQFDLYGLFIEKGIELLIESGIISMITSNTLINNKDFLQLRKLILESTHILSLANLDETIFESAQVDVCIINCKKIIPTKDNLIKIFRDKNNFLKSKYIEINQSIYCNESLNYEIKLNCDAIDFLIIEKIYDNKTLLNKVLDLPRGIEIGSNSDLIFDKHFEDSLKLLVGKDIKKYEINFSNRYIKFNKSNKSTFKDLRIYNQPKILIQRIRNLTLKQRIVACYDNEIYLCTNTLRIGILKNQNFNLKFILSILNSKVINYLFLKFFLNKDIYAYQLEQIPIPITTQENQEKLEKLVNQVIDFKSQKLIDDSTSVENHIDNIVYKLYDLKYFEVKIIDPEFSLSEEEYELIET